MENEIVLYISYSPVVNKSCTIQCRKGKKLLTIIDAFLQK